MAEAMKGTEHYVTRPDGRVYYCKVGRGQPLAFLHAAGFGGWTWRKVISQLAERFTCYNIDMPGFDHSDVPATRYSVEDYAKAILEVLDAAGIKQSSFLASHTGATVAVCLTAGHPQRVNKLVLDGLPYFNLERGKFYWENSFKPRFTDTTSYDVPVPGFISWEEALKSDPKADREQWERCEEIKKKSRYWMRLSYEAITSFDVEAIAHEVKAPTLLIYGDGEIKRYSGELAKEGIGGSTLKVIANCPGQAHAVQPQEFTRRALPFLLGH